MHFATEVLLICIAENGKHSGNRIVQRDTSMLEKKPALGGRTADTLGTSDEFSSFNQNFCHRGHRKTKVRFQIPGGGSIHQLWFESEFFKKEEKTFGEASIGLMNSFPKLRISQFTDDGISQV